MSRFGVSSFLLANFGWVLVGYVLACAAAIYATVLTSRPVWLGLLLILSTFGMFAVYWAMDAWPITFQIFPIALLCVLVLWLGFLGLLRDPVNIGALLALAFVTNFFGSLWTYGILHSKDF
jgi:hypothetical protein